MDGLQYRSGSWICLVRDSVVCLLPPETPEDRVREIWSLLGTNPALDRVFAAVSGGLTAQLADMPSFGVLARRERLHVLLRGPLELQQSGQGEPAASGEYVTTWSERVLTGSGTYTLRVTAPSPAGAPVAGMLPLESGAALVSALSFAFPPSVGVETGVEAGAEADVDQREVGEQQDTGQAQAATQGGAATQSVAATQGGAAGRAQPAVAAVGAEPAVHRAGAESAGAERPGDEPARAAQSSPHQPEQSAREQLAAQSAPGQPARASAVTDAGTAAATDAETAAAAVSDDGEQPDLGETVRPPEDIEVPAETLQPADAAQPGPAGAPRRSAAQAGKAGSAGPLPPAPPAGNPLIDSVPWLRSDSAAAAAQVSAGRISAAPAPGPQVSAAEASAPRVSAGQGVPAAPEIPAAPEVPADQRSAAYGVGQPQPAPSVPAAPAGPVHTIDPGHTIDPARDGDPDHDGDTIMSSDLAKPAPAAAVSESRPVTAPTVLARTCPQGHANPPTRSVCALCAQPLGEEPQPVNRPPLGKVVFSTGQVEALDRNIVIGRQPSVARTPGSVMPRMVQVPSSGGDISRSHAEIRLEGWHVMLRDLNSTNGTVLVRAGQLPHRLGQGEAVIVLDGDTAELGDDVWIRFEGLA